MIFYVFLEVITFASILTILCNRLYVSYNTKIIFKVKCSLVKNIKSNNVMKHYYYYYTILHIRFFFSM